MVARWIRSPGDFLHLGIQVQVKGGGDLFIVTILLRNWIDAFQREEAYQRGER